MKKNHVSNHDARPTVLGLAGPQGQFFFTTVQFFKPQRLQPGVQSLTDYPHGLRSGQMHPGRAGARALWPCEARLT
jgi:hypothetical protein